MDDFAPDDGTDALKQQLARALAPAAPQPGVQLPMPRRDRIGGAVGDFMNAQRIGWGGFADPEYWKGFGARNFGSR